MNGVWVGGYYNFNVKDTFSSDYYLTEVIKFKNGKYLLQKHALNGKSVYGSYELSNNALYFDSANDISLVSVNKDSLVFFENNVLKVYYKLHDSLKDLNSTVELVGRKYMLETAHLKDTLNFINDSLAVANFDVKTEVVYWNKVDLDGFQIILFDGAIPSVIYQKANDKLELIQYFKSQRFIIEMTEIE